MNYQVVQHLGGNKFVPALNIKQEPLIFDCPKKAAAEAAKLTKAKGCKFQPRPIKANVDWRAREQKRFADGHYKPVAWTKFDWWIKHHKPDHFVHISIKNPANLAFTRNEMDALVDTQTPIKPGKYLTEFFGHVLTTEQIREFAMQHLTANEDKELKFVTTPEEIERVYKPSLGSSCFSGTTKANLYGSGDFAVAYIEDAKGKITARAVCCPARKIFTYPYGDYYRLQDLLTKAGYRQTECRTEWVGLRLLKKWHWTGFYSDFGCRDVVPHPTDKEFLVIE